MSDLLPDDENDFQVSKDADFIVFEFKGGSHAWGQSTKGVSLEFYQIGLTEDEARDLAKQILRLTE